MQLPDDLAPSVVAVAVLVAVATAVLAAFGVPRRFAPALAVLRGAVQLAAISVILSGVLSEPLWIAVALAVMFTVATAVATVRIGWSRRTLLVMGSSIAAGLAVTLVVVFATGALDPTAQYLLAIGAITVGGAMSVATLTGRGFAGSVRAHWVEVEGWLAIGATPRQSTIWLARDAVRDALIPGIDQTRTTGLVVLPGAFVGAIFGGLSPLEAGRFQIIVLAALMASGAVTAVLVALWQGDVTKKPEAAPG